MAVIAVSGMEWWCFTHSKLNNNKAGINVIQKAWDLFLKKKLENLIEGPELFMTQRREVRFSIIEV